MNLIHSPAGLHSAITTALERGVSITLTGNKTTERKMSALDQADETATRAIAYGSGKVAKAAAARIAQSDVQGIVRNIASGNLGAFAAIVAAKLGEAVKFGVKDAETGGWSVKPSQAFREFGAVLAHKFTQLEDKGKVYKANGVDYTAAAVELLGLISMHHQVCEVMNARDEAERVRRENEATLRALEAHAEKTNEEPIEG